MTDTTLLPCPFCGPGQSIVSLWHDGVADRWRVGCGRCGCSTGTSPHDKSQTPAIAAWNRRDQWRPIESAPNGVKIHVRQFGWYGTAIINREHFVGHWTDGADILHYNDKVLVPGFKFSPEAEWSPITPPAPVSGGK